MASVIELEVTATAVADQFSVRVIKPETDEGVVTTMNLDAKSLADSRDGLELAVLASAVTNRRIVSTSEQLLQTIGRQLFDGLFSGPVGTAYRFNAREAETRGERLQVVLQLEAAELASLPWESMYDTENDSYIGLADPVIRHVPLSETEPVAVKPPLRVLVIVASPDGMADLDVEAERTKLNQALAEPIASGRLHLTWLMQATWEQVQDQLHSGTWHIVHFIGHGGYDQQGDQGVLAFIGEQNGVHLVDANRLAALLMEATPTPRLVVLNSCQSGRSGTQDLFSSTAATLVRRGIAAVAAMQFSISDVGATKFARGMYGALASGRSVGAAIGSGRVGLLSTPGSLEWVTPVLYVRGNSDTLFTIAGPPAPPTPSAPSAPSQPPSSSPNWSVIALGAAVAAAVALLIVAALFAFRPGGDDEATGGGATTTAADTSDPSIDDPRGLLAGLQDVGVDTTLPGGEDQLLTYLANPEYTSYPALAKTTIDLIAPRRLRLVVAIDAIEWRYTHSPGEPKPHRAEDVDMNLLERVIMAEFDDRHGTRSDDFDALLV